MQQEYDFHYPDKDNLRRAYRVQVPGLLALINVQVDDDQENYFGVKDLSAAGVALQASREEMALRSGQEVTVSFSRSGEFLLQNIPARVIRQQDQLTALEFHSLDRHQEFELDKLVLEVQKQLIEEKKKSQQGSGTSEQSEGA